MKKNSFNGVAILGIIAVLICVSLSACQSDVNTGANPVMPNPAQETQSTTNQAVQAPVDEAQALVNQASKDFLPEAQTFAHSDGQNRGVSLLNAMYTYRTAEGDDTWVYFFSNLGEKGLYKMKHDGSNKQMLYACDLCESINIFDGWVYFISGRIYKIRTDGTELTPLTDDEGLSIQVVGNRAYYQSVHKGTEIMKMKLDSSGKKSVDIENTFDYIVAGNEIFFAEHGARRSNGSNLWRKNMDSCEKVQLSKKCVYDFAVTDNLIFYTYNDFILRELNWDGETEETVFDVQKTTHKIISSFCISGETIFYIEGEELYRIDITGENKKLITNDFAHPFENEMEDQSVNMVGNWIYYYSAKDNGTCRISLDGSVTQRI